MSKRVRDRGWKRVVTAGVLALAVLTSAAGPARARASGGEPESPFCRVRESEDGKRLALEMAVRSYRKAGQEDGPKVLLAGAIHIGDRGFYTGLQERLERLDVVLYEGVLPPGSGRGEFDSRKEGEGPDAARSRTTNRRIRFLASVVAAYNLKHKDKPVESLETLQSEVPEHVGELIKASRLDAWGRELRFISEPAAEERRRPGQGFDLVSLGADGEPGGEGADKDVRYSDQPELRSRDLPSLSGSRGLQQQLASSLGLVFQLDAMDHERAHWRSSDLSVDQIQDRIEERGGDGKMLFSTLEGSSIQAGLARLVLGLIKMMPAAQVYGKVAMMEVLTRAEDITAVMPAEMGDIMPVILHDRNEVVLGDLSKVLKDEPEKQGIGIIYGAGHMPGIVERLKEMGFEECGVEWLPAMTVDLTKSKGLTAAEIREFRQTVSATLDRQMKASRKKARD